MSNDLFLAVAGNAAGEGTYVEDVFSTYLYTGNGSTQTITNGIDLDGEGGLVWFKRRDDTGNHYVFDTERGVGGYLLTDFNIAEATAGGLLSSFNSDGVTTDGLTSFNTNTHDFASWTFRKAPKFFDVVTYTGDNNATKTISHNLGSVPGFIIVKKTNSTANWACYHRSLTSSRYSLLLNSTGAEDLTDYFSTTPPTSTEFTVGTNTVVNNSGDSYVAYLFAHNDGDGGFGENGDQDIIKCGSFEEDGSATEVDLGFEPQWVLIKNADATGNWWIADTMRGFSNNYGVSGEDALLFPNLSTAETDSYGFTLTSKGFIPHPDLANGTHIYIAIRRGPMKTPESGTEVFANSFGISGEPYWFESGFPVDLAIQRYFTTASYHYFADRLRGQAYLSSQTTDAEATGQTSATFDFMEGWHENLGASSVYISHMFRRAPGFFDVVAYTGTGSAGLTVNHNLGVVPELIIGKSRDSTGNGNWAVLFDMNASTHKNVYLNLTNSEFGPYTYGNGFLSSQPTSTEMVLTVSGQMNYSGDNHIAYLFATLPGISKVGSYTGTTTAQTIDCGFTTGARFVLIKRTSGSGGWILYDSERGISAGNDPYLLLNTTDAEDGGDNDVGPHSSGFIVNATTDGINNPGADGAEYIFLAIA